MWVMVGAAVVTVGDIVKAGVGSEDGLKVGEPVGVRSLDGYKVGALEGLRDGETWLIDFMLDE